VFDIVEKSSKFLLEVITLVSSMNKMGSDKVVIVGCGSFTYIKKSKGPKIDPWGTPWFTIPHLKKISIMILFQFLVFCLSDGI
jgi:hypothetical protein